MREITDDLTDAGREVLQNIAERKVHVLHIEAHEGTPAFSYTVGLWHNFEQPEVLVFGLEPDVADDLLHTLADACIDGKRFAAGEKHEGLLEGFAVRFLDVPEQKAGELYGGASWAYQNKPFRGVQLIWPDKERRWPWQEGVRQGFRDMQPMLSPHDA